MSTPKWRPRTRADDLQETAGGIFVAEQCSCGRQVPVFEMVDAGPVPEHKGDWACGACREQHARAGRIDSAEWMKRLGAPAELVERLREKDQRLRPGPTTKS